MTDNYISLLKLNFKTNIKGHLKHKPYSIRYNDKTISENFLRKYASVPPNCMIFSDLVPFNKSDYSSSYGTFLKSLVNISEFTKIFKTKMGQEYGDEKINRTESFKDKVHEHNLLLILKLIFKPGNPFYLVPRENPYTIVKVKEAIKPVNEGKIITWKQKKFILFEYNIFIKLSTKSPGEISKRELEKSNCEDVKYTFDSIRYKLLSQHIPIDDLKDYYSNVYQKHLNNGEVVLEPKKTPKLYSKRGGSRSRKTRKISKKTSKKTSRKNGRKKGRKTRKNIS